MPKKSDNLISSIHAREILDARGYPTLEVVVTLGSGQRAKASSPVGLRISRFGAKDLHDGDKRRHQGRGVLLAANHINELVAPRIVGMPANAQEEIDRLLIDLDGTPDKRQLGANTMIALSLAIARAGAMSENLELYEYLISHYKLNKPSCVPTPLFNLFSGGHHADTNLDFQEFLLVPQKDSPVFLASTCEGKAERMVRAGAEVFHVLGKLLNESGYDTDTGLEGGYAPDMDSSLKAMDLMLAAIIKAGYKPKTDFCLGLDIGSTQLYDESAKQYIFPLDNVYFSTQSLVGLYNEWLQKYPLVYLEDGLADDDCWQSRTFAPGYC